MQVTKNLGDENLGTRLPVLAVLHQSLTAQRQNAHNLDGSSPTVVG